MKRKITNVSFHWHEGHIARVQVDCAISLDDELYPDEFRMRHYAREREQFPPALEAVAVEIETRAKDFVRQQEAMPDGS